jgi:hypothetical protein
MISGLRGRGMARYSPNTYSMVWLRISRSSGVIELMFSALRFSPDWIATYCLPPTSKVIGGAALTTAGGLLITAFTDGTVAAYDDTTLDQIWHFNVGSGVNVRVISSQVERVGM